MKSINLISTAIVITLSLVIFSAFSITKSGNDVQTITGTITSVDHPVAKMKADDGKEYTVYMGPYWFWNENNYSLSANMSAEIKGDVNGTDLYPWTIVQDGKTMTFTDDKGAPKWGNGKCQYRDGSGKGRGNGNGPGKGKCWRNK